MRIVVFVVVLVVVVSIIASKLLSLFGISVQAGTTMRLPQLRLCFPLPLPLQVALIRTRE